ncbi:MAG: DUF3299 domain-containing protein [Bacteriovoracaceae bacterium]|nr:DUF3299 domain-containing protein [Bacteriovoracaceae bacterium]
MKFLIFIFIFTFLPISHSAEINWQVLKTLNVNSKKPIPTGELKNILGKIISIKGFMMPLDYNAKNVIEFLFMPYIPACMHVPPPPANQLVLVKMTKGIRASTTFYPVELTGKLFIDIRDCQKISDHS